MKFCTTVPRSYLFSVRQSWKITSLADSINVAIWTPQKLLAHCWTERRYWINSVGIQVWLQKVLITFFLQSNQIMQSCKLNLVMTILFALGQYLGVASTWRVFNTWHVLSTPHLVKVYYRTYKYIKVIIFYFQKYQSNSFSSFLDLAYLSLNG